MWKEKEAIEVLGQGLYLQQKNLALEAMGENCAGLQTLPSLKWHHFDF